MKSTLLLIATALSPVMGASHLKTIDVAWKIPMDPTAITANTGDKLKFAWTGSHNVYKMASKTTYDACDFTGATQVGTGDAGPVEATMGAETVWYACKVSGHCGAKQKLQVSVTPAATTAPSPSDDGHGGHAHTAPSPTNSATQRNGLITCVAGAVAAALFLL